MKSKGAETAAIAVGAIGEATSTLKAFGTLDSSGLSEDVLAVWDVGGHHGEAATLGVMGGLREL